MTAKIQAKLPNILKRFLYHYTIIYKWFNTANFLFLFIIYSHILACIFVFLSYLDNPSWITNQNLINSSKGEIYIASFYYVFATVFTVGYGDIVSVNIYERVFNLILLIMYKKKIIRLKILIVKWIF